MLSIFPSTCARQKWRGVGKWCAFRCRCGNSGEVGGDREWVRVWVREWEYAWASVLPAWRAHCSGEFMHGEREREREVWRGEGRRGPRKHVRGRALDGDAFELKVTHLRCRRPLFGDRVPALCYQLRDTVWELNRKWRPFAQICYGVSHLLKI